MTTPLYPTFQKRIRDSFEQLIKKQVTPWAFLNSGKPMKVTTHDQRHISYEGGGFDGSPQHVFWGRYIEPFMEDISISEIDAAIKMATEKHVSATLLLPEVESLLLSGVRKTFSEMAKIDQRLRGKGFPEKIPLRSIENEFQYMTSFIEVRIQSELKMWRPKSKLEVWHQRNSSVIWFIGIVVSIVLGLLGIYAQVK